MKRTRFPNKTPSKGSPKEKETLGVFCRLRPMDNNDKISCMTILPPTTIQMTSPDTSRETIYTFKKVFTEIDDQKVVFDTVALPLVRGLIEGHNGLLFTYGVTGSGKTYTMTGTPQDGGIMPRTLDVLFNSISGLQAKKFIFKPDRLNGFEIQSDSDANKDRVDELHNRILVKTPGLKKKDSDPELNSRKTDYTRLSCIVEDNMYAVFVSYIEIYNNMVHDLLEDAPFDDGQRGRNLQRKLIREDGAHNMYVHSVTEVEVKSTEEAFEEFYKGQRRKRMAHNNINSESSRSHSIFSIRLVQAPLDSYGENILSDKKCINISQLSLVDLAGSERTSRTNNVGLRLKEAGKINNSLMTLRTCLEILRENQQNKVNKIVPYRDSRLTQLFKSYFDGEGTIHMIVCVNPRASDHDENLHVMKFAEMSQEVQVTKPLPLKPLENGLTPGRRRANQMYKQAMAKMEEAGTHNIKHIPLETGVSSILAFADQFPPIEMKGASDDKTLKKLMEFLEERVKSKSAVIAEFRQKSSDFRQHLIDTDKDLYMLKHETSTLRAELHQSKHRVLELENKVINGDILNNTLQRKVSHYEQNIIPKLQEEIADKECIINQNMQDKEKVKLRLQNKIAQTTEKLNRELDNKLSEQKQKFQMQMRNRDLKLREVKRILTEDSTFNTPRSLPSSKLAPYQRSLSSEDLNKPIGKDTIQTPATCSSAVKKKVTIFTPAVSNPRHRRSRSVTDDVWLEHRPSAPVPLSTVMQPVLRKRKSITKLTDVKDVTNPKTSKYCLMTQNQDSDGDLETNLYKGDVVPTCSGGAQVIFSDVEILKQKSPNSSPTRKRFAENKEFEAVSDKCTVSVEGHSKRSRK